MHFFIDVVKGIFIGAGAILPGISSGVLCVAFGIYEKLVDSVIGFFSDVKKNLKFLLPIAVGALIGVVVFGNILKYLFANFAVPASFLFAGLILGSIPSIFKESNVKKVKVHHVIAILLTLSFSIYLVAIEHFQTYCSLASTSFSSFVLAGFSMSAGVIIPGVSSTVILMLLGKYEIYLTAVSALDFNVLIPIGIGLAIGCILLMFTIKFLLKNFKGITYFAIIGFVLGSIPVLIPTVPNTFSLIIGILACGLGILVTLKVSGQCKRHIHVK